MTHPVGCSDLHCLVMRLRLVLHAETPTAINTHAAPMLRERDGVTDTRYPDEGGVGMPMTAAMHRFLGHSEQWGMSRLGMSSIIEVSEWCAPRHPTHRRPLFTRTLCSELAFMAGYPGQSTADIAWVTGLSIEQVSGMLEQALKHAEEWREAQFARLSKVPGESAPTPERRPFRPAGALPKPA